MSHVMLDNETLGLDIHTAPIMQIGATRFRLPGIGVEKTFFVKIQPRTNKLAGRTVDFDTLSWWADQDPALFREIIKPSEPTVSLYQGLMMFREFMLEDPNLEGIWSNGATFDVPMIESAMNQFEITVPWKFRQIRDCRTSRFFGEFPDVGKPRSEFPGFAGEGISHHALSDAIRQTRQIQQEFLWLTGLGPESA